MKKVCIYHGGCDDGFGAAYAMWKRHPETEFIYGMYAKPLTADQFEKCRGNDVYFLDFSYKREQMLEIIDIANSVTVLDHHKTAENELTPLFAEGKIKGAFDMENCGAVMAWEHFHDPELGIPEFFEYLKDRDLWILEKPNGKEFTMALRSYPQSFKVWDYFVTARDDGISRLIDEGVAIWRWYDKECQSLYRTHQATRTYPAEIVLPTVNCPYSFASEVAGRLADEYQTVGVCYFRRHGKWGYSARGAKPDGSMNARMLAESFGGGGHDKAAGWQSDELTDCFYLR